MVRLLPLRHRGGAGLQPLFFPSFDPLVGTLAAFATFAVGFVARPLGGIVFGHFGDKIGRKSMLCATLMIMGAATFAIGLLPTYEQIGVWAPVLLVLLRVLQGFGLGGEWGGAVLMAVEHAPAHRRGFYGSWPQIGAPAGLLVANWRVLHLLPPARGAVPLLGLARALPASAPCSSASASSSA